MTTRTCPKICARTCVSTTAAFLLLSATAGGTAYGQVPVADPANQNARQDRQDASVQIKSAGGGTSAATGKVVCSFSRTQTQAWNDRQAVAQKIVAAADRYGVDRSFALSIGYQETQFNQGCQSPVGAIGVMQLMPETARGLGVNPWDTDQNIDGGVRYLKQMLVKFDGNEQLAAAAYNAGPNRQSLQEGRIPAIAETQTYVARVTGEHKPAFDSLLAGMPPSSAGTVSASLDATGGAYSAVSSFGGSAGAAMQGIYQAAGSATGNYDRVQDAWDANSAVKVANSARLNELAFSISQLLSLRNTERLEQLKAESEQAKVMSGNPSTGSMER